MLPNALLSAPKPKISACVQVAFDNYVAAASARGLKLTIALANNWNYNSNSSDTKCVSVILLPSA